MIRTPETEAPPFPCSGSIAFIGGSGEKVRILQVKRCGNALVKRLGRFSRYEGATENRSEPLTNLFATVDEAFPPRRSKASRKPARPEPVEGGDRAKKPRRRRAA